MIDRQFQSTENIQGRAQDVSLGAKTEGPKATSGSGVLGEGQQPLHTSYMVWRSAEFPSGIRAVSTARRFSTIFSTQDGLS